MKHENGGNCERCALFLEGGHEDISYWFYRIKDAFPTLHTSCVFRGKDAQEKEVKEGRSYLKWPNSKHNRLTVHDTPRAEAMDLFSLTDGGLAEFRMGFYVQIANFLEDLDAPIVWGGNFKHLVDAPHFELKSKT